MGPYSPAVLAGDFLFVSGQIAIGPDGELHSASAAEQARLALKNLVRVLRAAGCGPEDLVKVTIYLSDMGDFPAVNEVYSGFFKDPYPARATVEVGALPKGAKVEIEAIAYLGGG